MPNKLGYSARKGAHKTNATKRTPTKPKFNSKPIWSFPNKYSSNSKSPSLFPSAPLFLSLGNFLEAHSMAFLKHLTPAPSTPLPLNPQSSSFSPLSLLSLRSWGEFASANFTLPFPP